MKFKSRIDTLTASLIYGSIAVMIIPMAAAVNRKFDVVTLIFQLITFLIAAFLLWMLYGTWYKLTEEVLIYKKGPIKGEIAIKDIHTIVVGKNLWVGYRPATARKGLIIKYLKYDEIYISPDSNEGFVEEILKIKPAIKIERD